MNVTEVMVGDWSWRTPQSDHAHTLCHADESHQARNKAYYIYAFCSEVGGRVRHAPHHFENWYRCVNMFKANQFGDTF